MQTRPVPFNQAQYQKTLQFLDGKAEFLGKRRKTIRAYDENFVAQEDTIEDDIKSAFNAQIEAIIPMKIMIMIVDHLDAFKGSSTRIEENQNKLKKTLNNANNLVSIYIKLSDAKNDILARRVITDLFDLQSSMRDQINEYVELLDTHLVYLYYLMDVKALTNEEKKKHLESCCDEALWTDIGNILNTTEFATYVKTYLENIMKFWEKDNFLAHGTTVVGVMQKHFGIGMGGAAGGIGKVPSELDGNEISLLIRKIDAAIGELKPSKWNALAARGRALTGIGGGTYNDQVEFVAKKLTILKPILAIKKQLLEEQKQEESRLQQQQALRQAAEAAEAQRQAVEAQRQAAEAEAQRKAAEAAEAQRQAAEAAEAQRQAAEAEAQRQAAEAQRQAAEAEAQRQAAEAEAQRQAAEAEEQRQAAEAAEAQRQAAAESMSTRGLFGKSSEETENIEEAKNLIEETKNVEETLNLKNVQDILANPIQLSPKASKANIGSEKEGILSALAATSAIMTTLYHLHITLDKQKFDKSKDSKDIHNLNKFETHEANKVIKIIKIIVNNIYRTKDLDNITAILNKYTEVINDEKLISNDEAYKRDLEKICQRLQKAQAAVDKLKPQTGPRSYQG